MGRFPPMVATVHALVAGPPCARHAPPYNRPVPAILIVYDERDLSFALEFGRRQ